MTPQCEPAAGQRVPGAGESGCSSHVPWAREPRPPSCEPEMQGLRRTGYGKGVQVERHEEEAPAVAGPRFLWLDRVLQTGPTGPGLPRGLRAPSAAAVQARKGFHYFKVLGEDKQKNIS